MVVGTAGELCVTRAMKIIGEVNDFTPRTLLGVPRRAFRVGWMWIGFAMMALAYFALLGMLARANVSYVVPVTRSQLCCRGPRRTTGSLGKPVTHPALDWRAPRLRGCRAGLPRQRLDIA